MQTIHGNYLNYLPILQMGHETNSRLGFLQDKISSLEG